MNQQRIIQKPDHFADLLTGDQAKKLHNKRSKARKHNQKEVISKHYQNYDVDKRKQVLQEQARLNPSYKGIPTNGVSLPISDQFIDNKKHK